MWAAKGGQVSAVRDLLEAGGDPSLRDGQGFDLLLLAVHSKNVFLVLSLLQDDIDVDTVDDEGHTPLMWAVYLREAVIARLLLRCGANILARDRNLLTALHWAAVGGEPACIQAVLEEGADLTAEQDEGLTPLALALKVKNVSTFEQAVRRAGRDTESKNALSRQTAGRVIFLTPYVLLPLSLLLLARAPIFISLPCLTLLLYGSSKLLSEFCNPGPDRFRGLSETSFFAGIFSASAFWTAVHWFTRVLGGTRHDALLLNVVFGGVFGGAMYHYIRAMNGDPGYTPRSSSRSSLRDTARKLSARMILDQEHFCFPCLSERPHRARHCKLCDRCKMSTALHKQKADRNHRCHQAGPPLSVAGDVRGRAQSPGIPAVRRRPRSRHTTVPLASVDL